MTESRTREAWFLIKRRSLQSPCQLPPQRVLNVSSIAQYVEWAGEMCAGETEYPALLVHGYKESS